MQSGILQLTEQEQIVITLMRQCSMKSQIIDAQAKKIIELETALKAKGENQP